MIHVKEVENEEDGAAEESKSEEAVERDPLEDTPEEDPDEGFRKRNLTEEDRLLYTVLAIENDCHIVPQGAFRMTPEHEVERNVAFRGLCCEDYLNI